MAENPLCPDCKKQMTIRYVCTHCGYDTQRIQTASNRRVAVMPYKCVRCSNPTAKKIGDIPVCGDCFVEGWGRLPDMPLEKVVEKNVKYLLENVPETEFPQLPKDFPCPKCKRKFSTKTGLGIHKKSKHGGTR